MVVRSTLHSGCRTTFPHRALRASPSLSLLGYCGKFVLQQKLRSSYIVNFKNVCLESSSEAATQNPTEDLAYRNSKQQNGFERDQGDRRLTTWLAFKRTSKRRYIDCCPSRRTEIFTNYATPTLLYSDFLKIMRFPAGFAKRLPLENEACFLKTPPWGRGLSEYC